MRDLGIEVTIRLNTDSETAKSTASRRGAGRIRHLGNQEMRVQEKVARKDIFLKEMGKRKHFEWFDKAR